jgi:hypothetical protein
MGNLLYRREEKKEAGGRRGEGPEDHDHVSAVMFETRGYV